eukprot:2101177-Prymnesium_polylepis.1
MLRDCSSRVLERLGGAERDGDVHMDPRYGIALLFVLRLRLALGTWTIRCFVRHVLQVRTLLPNPILEETQRARAIHCPSMGESFRQPAAPPLPTLASASSHCWAT